MNRFFLGTYWRARKQSIEECADQLLHFFEAFTPCDEALAHWYEKGRSRKKALEKPVDIRSRERWLGLLDKGRHWTNVPRRLMEDIGFDVWLWNGGNPGKEAGLHVACGGYSQELINVVILKFPKELGELKRCDRMRSVLAAAARVWQPDWAGVVSEDSMDKRVFDARVPFVDWMLYVKRDWLPDIPQLPSPAVAEPLEDSGTIIVVQNDPPDPKNPDHERHIQEVDDVLQAWLTVT